MKLNKFLSVAVFVILAFSITGCNKASEPIILTGTWKMDTTSTFLQIIYNPDYAAQYPTAIQFLKDNKYNILKEIKKPETIQFIEPDVVKFIYDSPLIAPVIGNYAQFEIYVTITNTLFPLGISGASNNQKLEIYYGRLYMLGILNTLLKPTDDTPETFSKLIDQFDGVGVYTRSN